jgi:hypothetical protein
MHKGICCRRGFDMGKVQHVVSSESFFGNSCIIGYCVYKKGMRLQISVQPRVIGVVVRYMKICPWLPLVSLLMF